MQEGVSRGGCRSCQWQSCSVSAKHPRRGKQVSHHYVGLKEMHKWERLCTTNNCLSHLQMQIWMKSSGDGNVNMCNEHLLVEKCMFKSNHICRTFEMQMITTFWHAEMKIMLCLHKTDWKRKVKERKGKIMCGFWLGTDAQKTHYFDYKANDTCPQLEWPMLSL